MSIESYLASRIDAVSAEWGGWYNATTGIGTTGDKSTGWKYIRPRDWTVRELADLYETDSLAGRGVDAVVEDALRQGFQIVDSEGEAKAGEAWLKAAGSRYDLPSMLSQLLSEARLYGGVLLVPLIADGRDPAEPLGPGRLRSLAWAEPDSALPLTWEADPLARHFREPSSWSVQLSGAGGSSHFATLHYSRVHPIFAGRWTNHNRHKGGGQYPYWPTSVLAPVLEGLRLYRSAMASVGALFQDASQGVYKVRNLRRAIMSAGSGDDTGAKELRRWMQVQDMMRSAIQAIAVDAGSKNEPAEEFTRISTPMEGLDDLVDRFTARVAEALNTPMTRLFGQAPNGLSTDDLSGTRMWYDHVQSFRERHAEPLIRLLVRLISEYDPEMPELPREFTVEWPSLWQFDPKEEAEARLNVANADIAYVNAGVFTPETVARVRGQEDGWRLDLPAEEIPDLLSLAGPEEEAKPTVLSEPSEEAKTVVTDPEDPDAPIDTGTVGAQTGAVLDIVRQVSRGEVPKQTAATLLRVIFRFSAQTVNELLGPVSVRPPEEAPDGTETPTQVD